MSEILFETAEECDCCIGDARWSRAFYAMDEAEAEAWLVGDTDGNWDSCEEAPGSEEIAASWDRYAEYVAETGRDPLCEYLVRRTYKRRGVWTARYVQSILGILVVVSPAGTPEDVLRYFEAGEKTASGAHTCNPVITWEFLDSLRPGENDIVSVSRPNALTVMVRARIEREIPRKNSAVERDLRRMARKGVAKWNPL